MINGQLSFDEILKEQDYYHYLNVLENMQLNQEMIFDTPDCKVMIKAIGETAWSNKSFDYRISDDRYGCCFSINDLAAHLCIGFLADSYKCKWIDRQPVAWEPVECH